MLGKQGRIQHLPGSLAAPADNLPEIKGILRNNTQNSPTTKDVVLHPKKGPIRSMHFAEMPSSD